MELIESASTTVSAGWRVDDDPASRSNVEREFQTPAQRLSKRQFDEETKRMMGQLTSRIAGSMAASQPKNGFLASAAEHLAAGGGHKGGGFGGGAANAAVNKARPSLYSHNNSYLFYSLDLRRNRDKHVFLYGQVANDRRDELRINFGVNSSSSGQTGVPLEQG